jgi:hypothetical protein
VLINLPIVEITEGACGLIFANAELRRFYRDNALRGKPLKAPS